MSSLMNSDIQLIKNYLQKRKESGIFEVSLIQLRLSCGLPKRIKDRDLKNFIKEYYSSFEVKR